MSKNIHICKLSDIPANGIKDFALEGGEKVLIANFSDNYYAYNGNCPHQGTCLAEGFFDGAVLTCKNIYGSGISPPESPSALPKLHWKAISWRLKTARYMFARPMR